ncbi:MAG: hypothetical protein OQK82_05000 [Candidatus Pacearchaeota archaeon]|nr:hypothetical protein [Candidatus Pacearchaeota archaeon]
MNYPKYLDLEQARQVMSEMGIEFSKRQMKRSAEKDIHGKRKLPFFIDPVDKKLKIDKGTLVEIYIRCSVEAERNSQATSE